jgi:hypothetical protein
MVCFNEKHGFSYEFPDTLSVTVYSDIKPVAKFLVTDWEDKVDNPMPESTISPESGMKNLASGQTLCPRCIVGWFCFGGFYFYDNARNKGK